MLQNVIDNTRTFTSAPTGLRLLFRALEPGDYAVRSPDHYRGAPSKILEAQADAADSYHELIFAAAERDFPDCDASASSELTAMAGFWCGVATAWYVMNAINGGAR